VDSSRRDERLSIDSIDSIHTLTILNRGIVVRCRRARRVQFRVFVSFCHFCFFFLRLLVASNAEPYRMILM